MALVPMPTGDLPMNGTAATADDQLASADVKRSTGTVDWADRSASGPAQISPGASDAAAQQLNAIVAFRDTSDPTRAWSLDYAFQHTYDTSRVRGWKKVGTLADKYFMIAYIGLLKGIESAVWSCGGSLSEGGYMEIGYESLRLGHDEVARYYLTLALKKLPADYGNRDYFELMLTIAEKRLAASEAHP